MKKNIFLISFLICLSPLAQFAQNAAEDLTRAGALFGQKNLSMDIDVMAYPSPESTGELLGKAAMRKSGDKYYSRSLGEEMIVNTQGTLIMDHGSQLAIWMDSDKKAPKPTMETPNMDSLLALNDSVVYVAGPDAEKTYQIYRHDQVIWRTDVTLDEKGYFQKISYYYSPDTEEDQFDMYKIELIYTDINTSSVPGSFFSFKKYLSKTGPTPELQPAYSEYALINDDQ